MDLRDIRAGAGNSCGSGFYIGVCENATCCCIRKSI